LGTPSTRYRLTLVKVYIPLSTTLLSVVSLPYLVFMSPSRSRVEFRSFARVFRQLHEVIVEADGATYSVGVDLTVSRRLPDRDAHLVIYVESGRVYVKDLGSTNGTYINSKRIESHKSVEISPNDTITIGYYTTARVEYKVTVGPERELRDSVGIAISILLNLRNTRIKAGRDIRDSVKEFESLIKAFKDWLEPCRLPRGVCEKYEEVYRVYEALRMSLNSGVEPPQVIRNFVESLEVLDKALEKAIEVLR